MDANKKEAMKKVSELLLGTNVANVANVRTVDFSKPPETPEQDLNLKAPRSGFGI